MGSDEGLNLGEELVLCSLEDSPVPLWELGWTEAPSRQRVAAILGPGLVSLAARGLIEVRRFDCWPASWEQGLPVTGDDLLADSRRVEVWSDDPARTRLAAHITEAGIRYL